MAGINQESYVSSLSTFFNSECNGLNIIYANIRSLRKNFNSFLVELNDIKENVHFIVLSEIWVKQDEINFYKIPGYTLFYCCNENYRAGGVVCYVRESFDTTQVNVKMTTADILILHVKIKNVYFKICCLYRLQMFSENNFIDELSDVLNELKNNVILIGDININLLNDYQSYVQNYLSLLSNHGFVSLINSPTRITTMSKTLVDHIFIRHPNINLFKSVIFDVYLTDHCLLGLNFNTINKVRDTIDLILHKDLLNLDLIKNKLEVENWDICLLSNDVNYVYDAFQSKLSAIVSNSKLIVKQNKFQKAKSVSPWINTNILNRITRRKKLYKIHRKRPYDLNFTNYFSRFCNKLRTDIDIAKNRFLENKINMCNGDSSQYWKVLNNIVGKSDSKNVSKIELENGTVISEPKQVAEEINNYFISVQGHGQGHSGPLPPPPRPLQVQPHSFFVTPTSVTEVLSTINNLKNKKSTGFDQISVQVVKTVAESIAPVLTHLINLSFSTGIFPEQLKLSTIVPIYKKGSSLKKDNLRPISLLSIFSKIIEKLMNNRLVKYLDSFKYFSNSQFGFRKGKSTEDALITVTERIFNSFNSKNKSTGVFIDFKKAFDLVDHNILLNKLNAAGVRGTALDWFRSFLTNRTQQTKILNQLSSPLHVRTGVPQGSVISATLFLIFINDLLTLPFHGQICAFADDVALFYSEKDSNLILDKINDDLSLLSNWCLTNKMQVNVDKTKYINFSLVNSFNFQNDLVYHMFGCSFNSCNCKKIEKVNNFRYLGVYLDENLNWEKHVTNLHSKIKFSIRTFYFLKNICSAFLLRTLYFALIDSRLQYAIQCWGGTFKCHIEKLRITQNHFVRLISNCQKRESSFPLFCELKILPIQHLYIYKVLRLFYARSGNSGTSNLLYNTRISNQGVFRLPKVNKSLFRHSYQYNGPKYFNQLPREIRSCLTLKLFSIKLKDWLFKTPDVDFLNNVLC
jgi:hypothetical protein